MKKVIFLCLLSFSLCLSKPADEPVAPKAPQQQSTTTIDAKIPSSTETTSLNTATTEQKAVPKPTNNATPHTNETKTGPNETKMDGSQTTTDENKTKKDSEPPKEETKKVEPPKEETKKVEPPKEAQTPTDVKPSIDNKEKENITTKPEEKAGKSTVVTTEKTVTAKPTETPKKEDDKPVLQARGFDGPSFIGGIILTLGLLAISFMGFKYYKNQTERNYHTL